ncbi:MAG: hypothetical protein CL584_04090 [Alteromonadaceae bacterium]|nr:hypothetical protein [Alteromonadaceae bacterium]
MLNLTFKNVRPILHKVKKIPTVHQNREVRGMTVFYPFRVTVQYPFRVTVQHLVIQHLVNESDCQNLVK